MACRATDGRAISERAEPTLGILGWHARATKERTASEVPLAADKGPFTNTRAVRLSTVRLLFNLNNAEARMLDLWWWLQTKLL